MRSHTARTVLPIRHDLVSPLCKGRNVASNRCEFLQSTHVFHSGTPLLEYEIETG